MKLRAVKMDQLLNYLVMLLDIEFNELKRHQSIEIAWDMINVMEDRLAALPDNDASKDADKKNK